MFGNKYIRLIRLVVNSYSTWYNIFMEWIIDYGYIGMFALGFAASTFVPIASEWLLITLILKGLDPLILLFCSTTGNYLGACTTYAIGYYGSDFTIRKVLRISDEKRAKAEVVYKKYGAISLLFSWIPVIGDPLCLVGGVFKMNFVKYSILVFIGKFIRYGAVVWMLKSGMDMFT